MTTELTCPLCKKHKLSIRFGKTGEFLGCAGYPECKFTSNFKRDENGVIHIAKLEEPQVLDEKCPQCGKPLRNVIGKFGPFVACSGYPDCKYIKENSLPIPCPSCGGKLVERRWKGGRFWGCKSYPQCKFAIFGDVELTPCPQCKLPFLMKKVDKAGKVTLFCHNKECGYKKTQE
jgi:DNA topoisomerase-1